MSLIRVEAETKALYDLSSKKEEVSIDKALPADIFQVVFSFLGKEDIQNASLASRSLQQDVISSTKYNANISTTNFKKFLINNLSQTSYPNHTQRLIEWNKKIFHSEKNLIEVENSIPKIKEKFCNTLKDLDEQELIKLETLFRKNFKEPVFFKEIFELT